MSIEKTVLQKLINVPSRHSSNMCFDIQETLYHKNTNIRVYE